MTEADLEIFRARYRFALLERLVLKTAFLVDRMGGVLSIDDTRRNLEGWLDANSESLLGIYGAALNDPALTALFADKAKEVTDDIKKTVGKIATDATNIFDQ